MQELFETKPTELRKRRTGDDMFKRILEESEHLATGEKVSEWDE